MAKKLHSGEDRQLASFLDFSKPRAVLAEARRLFRAAYPHASFHEVSRTFAIVRRLFAGRYAGYRGCSTDYHDLCHTLQVFTASSRLLDGARLLGTKIEAERAVDTLVAALLHDAGYIQEKNDLEGTGAKYTKVHVDRSVAFVRAQAGAFRLEPKRVERVATLMLGTDLGRDWNAIPWESEDEGFCASILAAADLLGQMSDRAYLEKLLFLYYEFREAGVPGYNTAFDILKRTSAFYRSIEARLDGPLGGASTYAHAYFAHRVGIDRDLYREAITRQMAYLDSIVADGSLNFRKKLKRLDLEEVERGRTA
jgi:hypothetical protein